MFMSEFMFMRTDISSLVNLRELEYYAYDGMRKFDGRLRNDDFLYFPYTMRFFWRVIMVE